MRALTLLLALLPATVALPLSAAQPVAATSQTALPQVQEAWIRWLPASLPEGGYLTLVNATDTPQVLVGASSADYAQVQLHQSRSLHGVESMVPVERLVIAAHSTLDFAAHGYHLMLLQPRASIRPGDHVPVTLHFAGGAALTVSFEVRAPAADAGSHGASMHDMPGMPGMSSH